MAREGTVAAGWNIARAAIVWLQNFSFKTSCFLINHEPNQRSNHDQVNVDLPNFRFLPTTTHLSSSSENSIFPTPPPLITPPPPESLSRRPIIEMMHQQELGKAVFFGLVIPVTIALWFSDDRKPKKLVVDLIQTGLFIGSVNIWNGIMFRKSHIWLPPVIELFGITLSTFSFAVLMLSLLPEGFMWALGPIGVLFLVPSTIVVLHIIKNHALNRQP